MSCHQYKHFVLSPCCAWVPLGKATGLLWQIFLVVGLANLRRICRAVRSVTTDMGTERLIANVDDILPSFLRHLGAPARHIPPNGTRLFERALQLRGWRHMIDLLVQMGLSLCLWFPSFLESVRALVAFLRDHALFDDYVRRLRAEGRRVIANMLKKNWWFQTSSSGVGTTCVVCFARWRVASPPL